MKERNCHRQSPRGASRGECPPPPIPTYRRDKAQLQALRDGH